MKDIRTKLTFALVLIFVLLSASVYSVSTTLQSPASGFMDDDGFLDLRASCEPVSENNYDGTTSWNITNATLYSNVEGVWKANKMLQVKNPIANSTYYFNFTNSINQTAEGDFVWNAQCHEANSTNDGTNIKEAFAVNRTIMVRYAKATVAVVSPADGSYDADGYDILINCSATPSSGWNITQITLMTNMSFNWNTNQTFTIPTRAVDTEFTHEFILNSGTNKSRDATSIIFSCSSTQIKNNLEGAPASEKSTVNRTLNLGPACTGNICDTNNQKWCEDGIWTSGTYLQYCSRCGYADSSCPVCKDGVCDINNRRWCDKGTWSAIKYCDSCGITDSSCSATCSDGACDTKNRKWCNNGAWEESNYCLECGSKDSVCYFGCENNACDTKNDKWCNNGVWSNVGYCSKCVSKDFSCGFTCQNNACDTTANKWCDAGSWSSLNYCNYCQDSECLGTCTSNTCDTDAKKWCNNGEWSDIDYCSKCGSKDSSCLFSCGENTCDTTSNKRCLGGIWVSASYCDYCGLSDSDCTIVCAEGECDTRNKKVCKDSKWNSTLYEALCITPESNISVSSCKGYGNCTIGSSCISNNECASGFCSNGKCAEIEISCEDGIKNGDESDADCGGTCSNKCGIASNCTSNQDCETNLECISNLCSKKQAEEEISEENIDTDNDGIPDEWEIKNGLNANDASDPNLDFDDDGLANIQEYTLRTNPNNADSDGDGTSDKEEVEKDTSPIDPVSRPGGIGGLLIWAIVLIILFGAGSYAIYYYKDYLTAFISPNTKEPIYQTGIPAKYRPTQVLRKPQVETDVREIVKERREEKERKRSKILEAFSSGQKSEDKPITEGKQKEDVFSELKHIPKNKKE